MKRPASLKTKIQATKISPKEILLKYLNYLPLFIISFILILLAAYFYIKSTPPVYSSTISMYVPDGGKAAGGSTGGDMTGLSEIMLYNKKVNLSNEIQILKTKSVMARVVEKLNLNLQYFHEDKYKTVEIYKPAVINAIVTAVKDSSQAESIEIRKEGTKLYHVSGKTKKVIRPDADIKGNNMSIHVAVDTAALKDDEKFIILWQPVYAVAGQLSGNLSVTQPSRDANILSLYLTTEVPEKGTEILNNLVSEYNNRNNEQKNKLVDYTLQFIDERMNLMRGELGKVESTIQSYRQSQEIIAPEAQSMTGLEDLASAKANFENSEVRLKVINMVRQSLGSSNQPIPTTLGIEDPGLSSLVNQYNQYYFQKEEQLKTMPAANPAVRVTQNQIEKLRSAIGNSLDNISTTTSQSKDRYLGAYQSSRSRLRSVPVQERRLLEIGRQQDVKEKLFMFLLQKKEEAAITKASGLSFNSTPLDDAETIQLITPVSATIYRNALILALILPILIIYIKDALNDKVITRADIMAKTAVPIIGEIAHSPEKKRKVVVGSDDRTIVAEQFRMIRTNIPLITKSKDKKTLLVTSTTPGEGKTFCSINLAAVFAVAGKRSIILELDLRKPKIASSLKLNDKVEGITHYISGQASVEDLIVPVAGTDNLFVITAGVIPPNPSEILMDEKMDELFVFLKDNFDCIVIDCAPVGLVSDAKILAKYADASIYLVRQRVTQKKSLLNIAELYDTAVFPNLSILVNDVKSNGVNSYYGYGNNYMSEYKYSYGKEQLSIWQKAKAAINL